MRSIIFALTLILTSLAQAYPSLGDKAEFVGVITGWDGVPKVAEITFTYTAYNAETDRWTRRQETKINGEIQIDDRVMEPQQVPTQPEVLSYVNNCTGNGGQSGTLKTPAGEFKACMLKQTLNGFESIFYIADVPFAYAGFEYTIAGIHTQMFLKAITSGN
jgi:hypothetical protein